MHRDDRVVCCSRCYFDTTTTIYGVSASVYVIGLFDTAADLVGEVKPEIPPA